MRAGWEGVEFTRSAETGLDLTQWRAGWPTPTRTRNARPPEENGSNELISRN
jgi:hypothetical protein